MFTAGIGVGDIVLEVDGKCVKDIEEKQLSEVVSSAQSMMLQRGVVNSSDENVADAEVVRLAAAIPRLSGSGSRRNSRDEMAAKFRVSHIPWWRSVPPATVIRSVLEHSLTLVFVCLVCLGASGCAIASSWFFGDEDVREQKYFAFACLGGNGVIFIESLLLLASLRPSSHGTGTTSGCCPSPVGLVLSNLSCAAGCALTVWGLTLRADSWLHGSGDARFSGLLTLPRLLTLIHDVVRFL